MARSVKDLEVYLCFVDSLDLHAAMASSSLRPIFRNVQGYLQLYYLHPLELCCMLDHGVVVYYHLYVSSQRLSMD